MTKDQFVKLLKDGTKDRQQKLDCCRFFINNYAVKIKQRDQFNPFLMEELYTKLINKDGSEIEINGGSDRAINHAFNQLQTKLKIFEDEPKTGTS